MDDEDLGPELTAAEKSAVVRRAKAAAELAVYERAKDLLPFDKDDPPLKALKDNQRRVATWLLVNKKMQEFYDRTYNTKGIQVMSSGRIMKHGGSVAGILDAQRIKSFEHLCQEIALIFCRHVDSDEIRELRAMVWTIECDFYGVPLGSKPPAPYVNQPTRGESRQRGGSGDVLSLLRKQRSRNRDEKLVSEGPFVVAAVRALGPKLGRELDSVEETAYKEALEKEETEVRTDPKRNRKMNDTQEKRNQRAARRETGKGILGRFGRRE